MQPFLDFLLQKHYIHGMNRQATLFLEEEVNESSRVYINDRAVILKTDEFRCVYFSGMPVLCYHKNDKIGRNLVMVMLVEEGLASTAEVAIAFAAHRSTIFRNQRKVAEGGIGALVERKRGPQGGSKIKGDKEKLLLKLKSQGIPNTAIAHQLGLTETGVRNALQRLGYQPQEQADKQMTLEIASSEAPAAGRENQEYSGIGIQEENKGALQETQNGAKKQDKTTMQGTQQASLTVGIIADSDASDRVVDRLLARMGLLDDAVPLFCSATRADCAGFLLALPFVISSGVFDIARKVYGSIGPAFYGLRTTFLTLLMMAIVRIKRAEGLKEKSPVRLGLLLGLDRAPEVKTLRRKLTSLAGFGKAYELLKQLVGHRLREHRKIVGYLYVDGFVRAYHGKRRLSKAYVAQRRLAMAGVTDYWVNDQDGEPLFVVSSSANEALTKMLRPVLAEIRKVVGKRRLTVVFDRGGWSPKLFQEILDGGFDIMTYRKGKQRKISKGRFIKHSIRVNGNKVSYQLHDQAVRFLKGKLRLRQVTRLREGNYQTQIITSRWDLPPAMVVFRMFNRWRQENYFKYMREEYALDVLVDYNFEAVDIATEVVNPERKEVAKKLKALRGELAKCEQRYGAEVLKNDETKHATMREFKITTSELCRRILTLRKQVEKLKKKQHFLAQRISAHEAFRGKLVRLSYERKLLTDIVKMLAYQAESALVNLIKPHYSRADEEGRTLIASFFQNPGMLELQEGKLVVTFDPLSSPHRSIALENLCRELNKTEVKFPGTDYTLEYRVQDQNVA